MEVRCRCPACQTKFKVDGKYAGKKARCPKCQQVVEVPKESLEASVPTAPQSSAAQAGTAQPSASQPAAAAPAPLPPMPAGPLAASAPLVAPQPASSTPPSSPASGSGSFADFQLQVAGKSSPKSATSAPAGKTGGKHPAKRKKSGTLPLVIGGGLLAVVLIGGGVAVWALWTPSAASHNAAGGAPGPASGHSSSKSGVLLLNWPDADRQQALLSIDGRRESYAKSGEVKFTLAAGRHKVFIQRRGFEPFETEISLAGGATESVTPSWKAMTGLATTPVASSGPAATANAAGSFPIGTAVPVQAIRGFDGWLQSFEEAKREAAGGGKDIVLVFGCSDAQPATQQLAHKLQENEAAAAINAMVRVVIDFPRSIAGRELVQDSAQNRQLFEEFGLDRLPALALADAQGRVYAIERDWSQGATAVTETLTRLQANKAKRDELLAAARQVADETQLQAAAAAVKWLLEQKIWRLYPAEINGWMTAAQQIDADNQKSLLEVFFEPHWFLKAVALGEKDVASIQQLAGELTPWIARKFQDQDRGVKLHLMAAQLLANADRFEDAAQHLDHATKYQPKDPNLARAVQGAKTALANRDVVGNGTGFLVSEAGYVLTNKHVADAPGNLEIRLPGMKETIPAQVVAKAPNRDIALLKFTMPPDVKLPALAIAPEAIGRGTPVAAFGYPLARELGSEVKLTDGLISALPDESNDTMYLLSVKINPGNSGGPLCNQQGDVVGMITAKTRTDILGEEDSYGLAIPSADLVPFLDQHLPPDAPRARPAVAPAAGPLNWQPVDQKVNRGVLMIVVKRR